MTEAQPVAVLRNVRDGELRYRHLLFWCPGCQLLHRVALAGEHTPSPGWEWDGNLDAPTVTPSLLTWGVDKATGADRRCHSFIRAGRWEFLTDSTHDLAGQTVPLPPLPDWVPRD